MALLSFVESAPRAYRLKASNAAPSISTSSGTIPDWKQDKGLALAMVRMMAGGLVLLGAYLIYRGLWRR
jgi:hypothetical protein